MDFRYLTGPPFGLSAARAATHVRYRANLRRATKTQVGIPRAADPRGAAAIKNIFERAKTGGSLRSALKIHDRP